MFLTVFIFTGEFIDYTDNIIISFTVSFINMFIKLLHSSSFIIPVPLYPSYPMIKIIVAQMQ